MMLQYIAFLEVDHDYPDELHDLHKDLHKSFSN